MNYAGPPFLFALPTNEPDILILQDAFSTVAGAYFAHTHGDQLCFYTDVPVAEEVHEALTEGGFDLWQEVAGVDSEREATYIMERETWHLYYGPEEEDN